MMRKIWFISLMAVFALQICSAEPAYAAGEFARKSEVLVEELHKYFPRVKGTVVSVRDEKIFIDIGAGEQIAVGAQLALFEEGIDIVDPKTKKVLGTYEEQIGAVRITEIMEQFSLAEVLWAKPEAEIRQGTHVGGFSGKVKLAILPLINLTEKPIQADSAYELFAEAMRSDERFLVFDEADIKSAAIKAGIAPSDIARKQTLAAINTVLEAHNFLQLTLRADADNILVQALLLSGSGEKIGSVQEIIREYADLQQQSLPEEQPTIPQAETVLQPQPLPEKKPAVSQTETVQRTFWTSEPLRKKFHKIAVGDLTGDGKNEVVIATQTDVEVLEHAALGEKDSFLSLAKIQGYNNALILSLDIADINGNGRQEIFMTILRTISAEVRVFEYNSGKFEEIWKTKGIAMRIIRSPAGKTSLVGQRTTSSVTIDFLSGNVAEYIWDGKDYTRQKSLHIPRRVKLFGFTLADLDRDGRNEVLFYDRSDRVNVFREGERTWRSRGYEAYKTPVLRKNEDEKRARRIPGRIELTQLGPDNNIYLVLFENLRYIKFIKGLPLYNGSQFYVFRWNGGKFVQEFQSEEFESYTVDYAVADIDNDGKQEVALAMVLKGNDFFRTPQSQIMVYELE
ncbi:MAG: VCBS repeat-containing protein [bacterium]|nr:VCBS repeat-containing protein [bacterium]